MDGRRPLVEADQHVPSDINITWLESIKYRADMSLRRKPPAEPTIFRVPPDMRCGNRGAYEPKLVSIGPYHRGKSEDLKAMEELKWRLLHHYLSKVPDGSRNEGLRKMKDLEKQARDCYSEVIDLNSDQFVEMLLLDGCFLVHIFITYDGNDLQAEELKSLLENNIWFPALIPRDLLLLENQLPYFIVEHLLDTLVMPGWNSSRLQVAAISGFQSLLPQYSNVPEPVLPDEGFQVDHLLHLFHKWILHVRKPEEASNTRSYSKLLLEQLCCALSSMTNASGNCPSKLLPWFSNSLLSEGLPRITEKNEPLTVPTTTELAEAGVEIKVREADSFLDISFCKDKGVLEIPAILIADETNMVFANLTALEQCRPRVGLDVTSYISFMDSIINTPRDVQLLHQKVIIHRFLGADEEIASLFNKQGSGVIYDVSKSYLKDVYRDLNAYCQSRYHRWRARAVRDYFSNPWAIISLGAAILLLGLTILQSAYGVLDYYKK